jgi:hypothetical protein
MGLHVMAGGTDNVYYEAAFFSFGYRNLRDALRLGQFLEVGDPIAGAGQ